MAPRAGLQRNAGLGERGPAQLLACKKAAARPLARRAHANATGRTETRTAASSQAIPDSCARRDRAERRTGGPDRRLKGQFRSTPSATVPDHGQRSQQKHTHNSKRTPRPAATAPSHPPFPPAALPQDVPDEADAREEDGPEPAHPPVDPHAHGQQDPLELEAAALAPHEARPLVECLKNVFVLVYSTGARASGWQGL